MPSVHIPDGYANAVIRWLAAGKPVSCTIGLENLGTFTASDMAEDLYDSLTAPSNALCKATNMRTIYEFVGVDVTSVLGGITTGASSSGLPVIGTAGSADAVLNSTSIILKKRTALIGRKHRGRMFLPGLLVEDAGIDPSGAIQPVTQSIQNATVQASFSAMLASTVSHPVLLHSVTGVSPDLITSLVLVGTVGLQRRRLIR